jgi:ABC-2 type transport system permease protein
MTTMAAPASFGWFARHELRLAWRDTAMMLQGGRRGRARAIWAALAVAIFVIVLHLVAYAMLKSSAALLSTPDKAFLVTLTGSAFLAWLLLLSQAMETVTRGFYARADLDLILSSPAAARKLLAIRLGAQALTTIAMAALLVGPVVDAAAWLGGPRILLAYGVLVAMGGSAVAVAIAATAILFRVAGPKRTRFLAQIVAAVVGAGFVVAIQAAAILSTGSLSRVDLFRSPAFVAAAPSLDSPVWWPAKAALGEASALVALLGLSVAVLLAIIGWAASAFARNFVDVAGQAEKTVTSARRVTFRARSRAQTLRRKEWVLLWRDPWLVSQSLMQVLYLAPPALLLWRDFDSNIPALVILAPVLVMAAGQLAGGLAWLAISGEDAPDLVATAPITGAAVLRAKIEAVLIAVALPIAPITIAMACATPMVAAITALGVAISAAGASAVQLFFRSQAKRSNFRRRQTSSRLATFAEAFFSISIAAATGLAASGEWLYAVAPGIIAALVLVGARAAAGKPA